MTSRTTWLHRSPAWVKLLLAAAVVVAVTALPMSQASWLAVPAVGLVLLILLARLPLMRTLRRLILLEPFVLCVALLALFTPASWEQRWFYFGFLVARCTICLLALTLFTATTPFADILRLFQKLRVPGLLVTTLALMHRYLFVLADETGRMRRARASRTFSSGRRFGWRTLSTVIAQLFLRASDRADRIYNAMLARGWNGGE